MDSPEVFHAKVFLLFWLPMSMFASIIVYDRARRRGMDARTWAMITLTTGLGGVLAYLFARRFHPKSLADPRPAGIAEDVAAGSARAGHAISEEKTRRPGPATQVVTGSPAEEGSQKVRKERNVRLALTAIAFGYIGYKRSCRHCGEGPFFDLKKLSKHIEEEHRRIVVDPHTGVAREAFFVRLQSEETSPRQLSEQEELGQRRKMTYFYAIVLAAPLLGFALGEGVISSDEVTNFSLFSIVFILIVFFLRDEFMRLPLVPRASEIVIGASVIGLAFLLIPVKPLLEAISGSSGTRPFGMLNYSMMLVGVLLAFFGISNFRIPLVKAIALGGGLGLVALGLLRFTFSPGIAVALVAGAAMTLYGVHRLPPIYMPALVVVILVLINSGFYNNYEIQLLATNTLGEFVARFSTGFITFLGIPAQTCGSCANLPVYSGRQWDIIFQGQGIPGGATAVSIVGNCTGIVGAMFYGFIASVILLWVRAEWWRKAAVLAGGVIGSFITNLFRISALLWVYWEYDYPARITYQSNLLYVHEHIGDVMYIAFILVYWVFVFRFILPRGGARGEEPAASTVQAPPPVAVGTVAAKRRRPPLDTQEKQVQANGGALAPGSDLNEEGKEGTAKSRRPRAQG